MAKMREEQIENTGYFMSRHDHSSRYQRRQLATKKTGTFLAAS
jgi:hypothetical protein